VYILTYTCSDQAAPPLPLVTSIVTAIIIAPEDVEHPVGRRREAHGGARGGARAGGEGAGALEEEEQQEGDEQPPADLLTCMYQEATQTERARMYVNK
jgi:hypothetical protein